MTSSGRVSTSTTITWHSGLLVVTDWAIDRSSVVVPVRGGVRTRPRWPLPIGAAMSTTLPITLASSVARRSRWCGCTGTESAKSGRSLAPSASVPLMLSMRTIGLNFSRRSPSRGWRTCPTTASPRRRWYFRTIDSDR